MALASSIALGGCKPAPAEPGSCHRAHENACVEYDGARAAAGKRLCSGTTWTPGAASCPAEGRVGTCAREGEVRILYGGAPNNYDPASAKVACEAAGGAFSK